MKKLMAILFSLFFVLSLYAQVNPNNHYVQGYTRSDGTYVRGHYRTNPNSTNRDNYSTYPNVNPWTGERGTVAPDNNPIPSYSTPDYSTPSYYSTSTKKTKTHITYTELSTYYSTPSTPSTTSTNGTNWYYSTSTNRTNRIQSAVSYHNRYSLYDRLVIEQFLRDSGFYPGSADGLFTEQTIQAIKELQRYIGVSPDGMFGPNTIRRIEQLTD